MYGLYALVVIAFIGLVYTVLKFTGLHDKIFKKKRKKK
jgi:hypothetical protein